MNQIRYRSVPSSLGQAVIGWTDEGICCVLLADAEQCDPASLLSQEFPKAGLAYDGDGAAGWTERVSRALDGHDDAADIPLDLKGTSFQREVWDALRRVPLGETASYTRLAELVGRPSAVRAVASACASNHVAVLVPCHRIVRQDGNLGGYKWGLERKRELLRRESRATRS